MARSVVKYPDGRWWAHVWDEGAVRGTVCPAAAMRFEPFASEQEAVRWCAANEDDVRVRYRAECAWEARLPAANESWLPYYRIWNVDERVNAAGLDDPEEALRLWLEVYEQGW